MPEARVSLMFSKEEVEELISSRIQDDFDPDTILEFTWNPYDGITVIFIEQH